MEPLVGGLTASDGDNGYSAHSPTNDKGVIVLRLHCLHFLILRKSRCLHCISTIIRWVINSGEIMVL